MATLVLQTVGAAIGGSIGGPFGAILGRAAGAVAGHAVDQSFLTKDRVIQGPRLENSRILASIEGAPIPRIYGRNRISGQIIWATRFEEVASTEKSGGKGTGGKTRTTSFSYFANFAVGLCEGPISGIRRIWADGKELDLTKLEYRFYPGDEEQEPDPLIEAKQGTGKSPAFRGTAYVVFETFPLEDYGNRIPQLSFEVISSIGWLERKIESITVIPGSTEFGYEPSMVATGGGNEVYNAHNRHTSIAISDWAASIDELQMVCPNLKSISLVVAWFGDDLRAGECQLLPGVTTKVGSRWKVSELGRHQAHLISSFENRPAFGGTPDDKSVLNAISDLKKRGLKVTLYPFIMMDIPGTNDLPGLSGETTQPAYPWRGELSCFPNPGSMNSADKSSSARDQLQIFEEQYQRFILHYASLCKQAGGVDGFLIGSELKGLTRVRDDKGSFPFVDALTVLAAKCRQVLGTKTMITYGADWSEYFGYHPRDDSGDVLFNLDKLWASKNINAIGIDNYMPLSDWRDEGDPENEQASSVHSLDYLKSNIAQEEGHDWYYVSEKDRFNGVRTPITDGRGEAWIFRYKDIRSWWENPHHNRIRGKRQNFPTGWIPKSKPVWFTEVGCPAVDKGTNQPNVFYDPKSAQSALPYFSSGGRDDLIQRRYLEAHYEFWNSHKNNPISKVYNGGMVDKGAITPWAWDARPFPWFPIQLDKWSDGENWHVGHWLTGRLGSCSLQDLVTAILKDYGYEDFIVKLDGIVDGYIIPDTGSARSALEPLLALHNVQVIEQDGTIIIQDSHYADQTEIDADLLVREEGGAEKSIQRENELELPAVAIINHASIFNDYEETATKSRRREGGSNRQITLQAPIVMPDITAEKLADSRLRQDWTKRELCSITLPIEKLFIAPGDIVEFTSSKGRKWQVDSVERTLAQKVTLSSIVDFPKLSPAKTPGIYGNIVPSFYGKPQAVLLDLPLLKSKDQNAVISHVAISASPWAGSYNLFSSYDGEGFLKRFTSQQQAIMGMLKAKVSDGPVGRWDYKNNLLVSLPFGSFESLSRLSVLNGENIIALESKNGSYELTQFANAELLDDGTWKLSRLLRAQLGTEPEMQIGTEIGLKVILLNEAIYPLELKDSEGGLQQFWRTGPAVDHHSANTYSALSHTNNLRSQKMLSPVHLRAMRTSANDYQITWIRRGSLNADTWEGSEISLDVRVERYVVAIRDAGGIIKRSTTTFSPHFTYSDHMRSMDLGTGDAGFSVEVAQLNNNGEEGNSTKLEVNKPK